MYIFGGNLCQLSWKKFWQIFSYLPYPSPCPQPVLQTNISYFIVMGMTEEGGGVRNILVSIISKEICVSFLGRNLSPFSWKKFVSIFFEEIGVNIFFGEN